jgi:iron complex transport system permease protein
MLQRKQIVFLIILLILVVVLFMSDIFTGSVKIPASVFWDLCHNRNNVPAEWKTIILQFRIPKAITAVMAGAALSVSGLQMQTVFRNPLAGPYVLGISAGASLGVAIMVMGLSALPGLSGFSFIFSNLSLIISAWLGAAMVFVIVLSVSLKVRDIMTILVLGILFGSLTSAVVNIIQYFSNESLLKAFIVWTMGSLGSLSYSHLALMVPCILFGLSISLLSVKILNSLMLGENYASTLGINIRMARLVVFLSTCILAGTITAFCGPIGFIDIAVPHIARLLMKSADHKILLPSTILLGAAILLVSDIISQLPGGGTTLPVNSVTALIGVPVIIWLIMRKNSLTPSS